MRTEDILSQLRVLGTPEGKSGMQRFGIDTTHALGVSIPAIRGLGKKIKKDHVLAQALWETGVHEARILASLVDDPAQVTLKQINAWVKDFNSWDLCDQVCGNLFDRTPFAVDKAKEFSRRKQEFAKRAGFVLMAEYAVHNKQAEDEVFLSFLPLIEQEAYDDRNFVMKAVNWALRQIGKRNARLHRVAIHTAESILKQDSKPARWIAQNALRELKAKTFLFFCLLMVASCAIAQKLPILPIGEDAYLQWDKWYMQRIGARTYMRSTYDRSGGNESADASHFLYMKEEDRNYTLDIAGKGVVYFIRTNHWHGSPWHYIVDGKDNIVQETGTSDPVNARKKFSATEFIPSKPFPQPLAWTWSATKGADLVWTPMPFDSSFQMAYSRTHYGTGYYIYQLYANKEQLSGRLGSWDINRAPDQRVIDLLARSGTDIAPQRIKKISGSVVLDKESLVLADVRTANASVIRALKFTLPMDKAISLERVRLKIYWDNAAEPSIDAPLCLFFGAGTFYNRDNREFLVKGFPINVRYDQAGGKVELGCYYPMPFSSAARVELSGIAPGDAQVAYEIRYEPNRLPARLSAYFHGTYQDIPHPEPGVDMTFLDTRGVEGKQQWSGSFVGMSFIFSHNGALGTLEGDPRFFFDDSQTPQAYGTGTEEWGGGGDYWGGQNMTLPLAGHPLGAVSKKEAKDEKDLIESAYRFLLADLMPFGNRALIRLEHGGENLSTEHYESVTYWYGAPAASLIRTDEIDVGNLSSEQAHAYLSPQASAVETISSRYEWGIDTFPAKVWGMDVSKMPWYAEKAGKEIYPVQQADGRHTTGSTEFTVALDPRNLGALLRRTLDYSYPNQRAEVYVAGTGANDRWEHAGTWWLAGSNTCMFSGPKGELDKRSYNVQTSDRRLRDDEFLIPARMVKGSASVRVRITFTPVNIALYPGQPFPKENAWSELKYEVYSYVMPSGVK